MSRLKLNAPWHPWRTVKKFLPKSLFGRSLVILLTPLLLVQVVLGYIFFDRHTETILRQTSNNIAGEIALMVDLIEQGTVDFKSISNLYAEKLDLQADLKPNQNLLKIGLHKDSWLYGFLSDALEEKLKNHYFLRMSSNFIFLDIQTTKGLLQITTSRKRLFSRTTPLVLIWTTTSALLLFMVASLFMRNQIRPLSRLADAAESFGKGEDIGDFKVEGAIEIRQAGLAFNLMRSRIKRYLQDRLEMLSQVSHDLRTPLTRMKLQLALLPKTRELDDFRQDVQLMQEMVQGFLTYARGTIEENHEKINLKLFINEILAYLQNQFQFKDSVTLECPNNIVLHIKKQNFNRCLTNLVLNSSKYARSTWITCSMKGRVCEIIFDDDGHGIPESERERVFQPFYRLDQARNLDQGGVGLGLTIVRDVILGHGGKVYLQTSPKGGLRVILLIPV